MSKIGKINISIPEKVKVVLNGSILNLDGPLGKKTLNIDTNLFDLKTVLTTLVLNLILFLKFPLLTLLVI